MGFKKEYSDEEKKPFNMAVIFLERLNNRLNERDIFRTNLNYIGWFCSLRTIWANIQFKVREAGHEEKENLINNLFSKSENYMALTKETEGFNVELFKTLDTLDKELNTLMFDYGLIFPRQEYKTYEEVIDEEYK